jgi:type II secretory pathway component GspD/PulD (secretin)
VRHLLCCVALVALATVAGAEDKKEEKSDDTPAAAKTRKLLKKKISVEFKNTAFRDVIKEIKDEVEGLSILIDSKGGVSGNKTFTYAAKDKAVEEILSDICKNAGDLGFYVISKKGNAYDGSVMVRKSDERGYEKKK